MGLRNRTERLKYGFEGYNGRYLGNLLIIFITRSAVASVVICSLTMFLLIFVLSRIFDNLSQNKRKTLNYMLSFTSVLALVLPNQITFGNIQPFQIFGSIIGWFSGFTNYVVPSVLILIYYYFVTNKKIYNKALYVFLLFDGILACLCVEHYTLFCLAFSIGVIAYRYLNYKRICKKSLFFFIGSFIGAAIMFLNSSYRLMQKGELSDNQRAAGFFGSLKNYADYIFPAGTDNAIIILFEVFLLVLISAVLILFARKSYTAFKSRNIAGFLPVICMVVMTLPLLFTNSGKEIYIVAPRCYFLQYFMLVIFLYRKSADKYRAKAQRSLKRMKGLSAACLTLLIIITSVTYSFLDYAGVIRDEKVNAALLEKDAVVEIFEYPKSIESIQWSSNSIDSETYLERYKLFKNIPDNREVEIVKKDLFTN